MPRLQRPKFTDAVQWIAYNDEPSDRDVDSVAGFVSVVLVADLWQVAPEFVAEQVVALRVRRDV